MDTQRITGHQPHDEAFIPVVWAKMLETALRPAAWVEEWRRSPEGQRAAAEAERRRQEAAAEQRRLIARHAELVVAEQHPLLATLLGEHAPDEVDGQIVCLTCQSYQCFECTEPTWP